MSSPDSRKAAYEICCVGSAPLATLAPVIDPEKSYSGFDLIWRYLRSSFRLGRLTTMQAQHISAVHQISIGRDCVRLYVNENTGKHETYYRTKFAD